MSTTSTQTRHYRHRALRSVDTANEPHPAPTRRTGAGIAVVLVAQLMLVLDGTVVNVGLPSMDSALGFTPASLSWVVNAYTLTFGGLLLLGGRLGDAFGRRRVFNLGIAIFTISSLVGGLAQSPEWLIAARAVQGIGAALAAPSVLALLTTSAPDQETRRRYLALFSAVGVGGGTLGLLLGGLLTGAASWRWTLFINVPFGLVVLALTGRVLVETQRHKGRFDFVGAATATGAAASIVWALIETSEFGWTSSRVLVLFGVGAVLLLALWVTERRVEAPIISGALVRSTRRVGALAAGTLVLGGQIAIMFMVVQYLQHVAGYGPFASGAAFLPMTVAIFGLSRVMPRLVARFGQAPLLMLGTIGLTGSYVWFSFLDGSSSVALGVLLPMLLNGLAAGMCFMPITSLVLEGVDAQRRRVGLGTAADHPAARRRDWSGHRGLGLRGQRHAGRLRPWSA